MVVLALIGSIFNFFTFLSGIVFGILICGAAALHFLSNKNEGEDESKQALPASSIDPNSVFAATEDQRPKEMRTALLESTVKISGDTEKQLNAIIEYLEEKNSPMKALAGILQKVHLNKDDEMSAIEAKMKTIIDFNTIARIEKDFSDNMNKLKDFSKQLKLVTNFMNDMGKTYNGFSQNLSKLANNAKNNMNRNNQMEHKEDLIVNSWWQLMQTTLEHTAADQYEFGGFVSDELSSHSQQVLEEISLIEKRLYNEGNRQFNQIREHIALFESKLREREKSREKARSSSITTDGHQKRLQKVKACEELLVAQTKKLYEAQREFYQLIPRITSDVQLTILKSIVETQSQLSKLTEGMERAQLNNRSICKKMKLQLTNAAASMLQMIRSESRLMEESKELPSIALDTIRARMEEAGVEGYEISLQKVLEGLLLQSQLKEVTTAEKSAMADGSKAPDVLGPQGDVESAGKLNMFKESSACLAASNPGLLPEIPRLFNRAIGVETCIWFNAFSGRVYRDIANSEYFYYWFCGKLAQMLNKREKERPAYIDSFQVTDVKFGELPPLLMNVKWSPYLKKKTKPESTNAKSEAGKSSTAKSEKKEKFSTKIRNTFAQTTVPDDDEEEEENQDSEESDEELDENGQRRESFSEGPADQYDNSDPYYYAACTADMAFRSGIKFTVATKLWLNWPRDRYASVPVLFHMDLAEMTGRIRFGVTRNYSFITFLRDPTTRINVRSEVGGDKYKLKDIPQVSDYIVKKLKSFIHRKIVHPHCHKFRLIWPRNWWPKGTENFFVGVPVSIPSSVMQNLDGSAAVAASAAAGEVPPAEKLPVANTTPSSTATANPTAPTSTSSYQFNDYASDFNSSAKGDKSSKNGVEDSMKLGSDNTSSPAGGKEFNRRPSMKESPSDNNTQKKEKYSRDQVEVLWHKHMRSAAIKMDLASFNRGAGSTSISDADRNFYLKSFYKDQRDLANSNSEHQQSLQREDTPIAITDSVLPGGISDDSPATSALHSFQIDPNVKMKRSYSVSDFRHTAMEVVLDKMLSSMNHELQEDDGDPDDAESDEQRSAFSFQMNPGNDSSSPSFNQNKSYGYYNSSSGMKLDDEQIRTRPRGRSDAQHNPTEFRHSTQEEFSTSWLKARGRESMARAKAQFTEFKSKHFKPQEKEVQQATSSSSTAASNTTASGTTAKRTSMFGEKLKDLLSINEDHEMTKNSSAGGGTSSAATSSANPRRDSGSSRFGMFAKAMSSMRQHLDKDSSNTHTDNK